MSTAPAAARVDTATALSVDGVSKSFGALRVLDDFSFNASRGEVLALLGPNGAGKTTLFNLLTGFLRPDGGALDVDGQTLRRWPTPAQAHRLGLTRTFQDLRLIRGVSVLDNVLLGFPRQRGEDLISGLVFTPRAVRLQEAANLVAARDLLERVGMAHKSRELAGRLSYGQQKLLSLACALATDARTLLLDEPVAGVNPRLIERILALIRELAEEGRSMIVIEHNVHAVRQVADRIVFMDAGRKVCEGDPETVLSDGRVLEAYIK